MSSSVFVHCTDYAKQSRAEKHISTTSFLELCRQLLPVIDKLGTGFILVRNDISGNIDRLAKRHAEDTSKFESIFALVEDEVSRGVEGGSSSCTKGLLWLKRAMEFVTALLQRLCDDRSATLSAVASDVYTETLYRYHGWISSSAFTVAMKILPTREAFLEKLGGQSQEALWSEMQTFLSAFNPLLREVHDYLAAKGLDDPTKV